MRRLGPLSRLLQDNHREQSDVDGLPPPFQDAQRLRFCQMLENVERYHDIITFCENKIINTCLRDERPCFLLATQHHCRRVVKALDFITEVLASAHLDHRPLKHSCCAPNIKKVFGLGKSVDQYLCPCVK